MTQKERKQIKSARELFLTDWLEAARFLTGHLSDQEEALLREEAGAGGEDFMLCLTREVLERISAGDLYVPVEEEAQCEVAEAIIFAITEGDFDQDEELFYAGLRALPLFGAASRKVAWRAFKTLAQTNRQFEGGRRNDLSRARAVCRYLGVEHRIAEPERADADD